jgi:protein DGCR14
MIKYLGRCKTITILNSLILPKGSTFNCHWINSKPFTQGNKGFACTIVIHSLTPIVPSEDNASFTDLLEKANAKRKSHYRWFYDKQAQQLCIADDSSKPANGGNLLMYYPEGPSHSLLDESKLRGAPKSIAHDNTALPTPSTTKSSNGTNDSKNINNEDGSWKELCGDEGPAAFRGFGLVESTPLIHPSSMDAPLMTWGSIEGTPLRLARPDTGNIYKD